ncbi:D-alanyl-D-alanine carboxypeptidase [Thalassotalea insulae]|uniref:D-alanyl-D-alanine carboxypeptidase n=1 Tax=Thalassotalea insulae TaxID=2056778 RepID=A0ABQ6GRK4_9GAMM|nr:serine hydrolase domain-containing protein [Thalassotalea insulae]GLX78573.1 D-alanyl-D-alanine carboxypeptidase [Thalassotalea insulae]
MKLTQPLFRTMTSAISCAIALTLSACGGSSSKSTTAEAKPNTIEMFDYQALIDNAVTGEIPGVVLYIDSPELHFHGAAGLADLNQQTPMQIDARIPNGSAGKKLTALLAGMLAEQQLLNLDANITDYLAPAITNRIANGSEITIRQMLQHTAGLFDYLNDSDGAFYQAVRLDPDSIKTDIFAIQFAFDQDAKFAPGQDWSYSNTGYILTGLVMDQVLGDHHFNAMRSQIFEPFSLNSMSYGGLEKDHAPITSGYFKDDAETINTRPYYQNIGVADAPVVSTAKDMADLLKLIVDGAQMSATTHDLLVADESFVDTGIGSLQYSHGLFKETINGKQVLHHGGSELGYATYNFYISETDTSVAMLINCNGYQACDNAHTALYQQVINQLTK